MMFAQRIMATPPVLDWDPLKGMPPLGFRFASRPVPANSILNCQDSVCGSTGSHISRRFNASSVACATARDVSLCCTTAEPASS
jgi:hypothetical protein